MEPTTSSSSSFFFLLLLLLLRRLSNVQADGPAFGLDLHHRFSDKLRRWAQSGSSDHMDWPEEGSLEYYEALVAHDEAVIHRRRRLAGLTFARGNRTTRLNSLGFLHYVEVDLGTPNVTFLVALDTGSDLFWIPCDCKMCAPTYDKTYKLSFNIFNSAASSTSERVSCSSTTTVCERRQLCKAPTDDCPFEVRYVDNSSTSGVLLQDLLHLQTDDDRRTAVKAKVTFGCGTYQPDTFTAGTPNGLLGLGLDSLSVPSTLRAHGLITSNSFSMCFSPDGRGRIRFGDKGTADQHTTPFYPNSRTYLVNVTDILVENKTLGAGFSAFFDTGTSFSLLSDPVYRILTQRLHSLVLRQRVSFSQLPFEYCYSIGQDEKTINYPGITFIMNGGKPFHILRSVIVLGDAAGNAVAFCLTIIKSEKLNIIGQNFMTGYRIVFDRDEFVLGWKAFDCYRSEEATDEALLNYNWVYDSQRKNRSSGASKGDRSLPSDLLGWVLISCILLFHL